MATDQYRHIMLKGPTSQEIFTVDPKPVAPPETPKRDREAHSAAIRRKLEQAWAESKSEQAAVHAVRHGVYIEFRSDPGFDLATKSLEDFRPRSSSKRVRLLNVRTIKKSKINKITGESDDESVTYATVYVPNKKRGHFLKIIQRYAEEETKKGKPKHALLIESIGDIRKAMVVKSFWQDPEDPPLSDVSEWCEVWLSSDSDEVIGRFEALLQEHGIQARDGVLKFPERSVKVVLANGRQLELLTTLSDDIAEYRRAKETAAYWTTMDNREQAEWVKDLLGRIRVDESTDVAVCILDTGVNNAHPLIEPILKDEDCLTYDPKWGTHDHDNHGTLMAGLAAYGDLQGHLESRDPVDLRHGLESVKVLPPPPEDNQPDLWGYITAQAVSRAEIQSPDKKRIIGMAVTAEDTRDIGRPSSWSGEIDQLASGAEDDYRRLIIISAGNATDNLTKESYPHALKTDLVHDPAQAWNALTVGAYTELVDIQDKKLAGHEPLAPREGLSPFSTTSYSWDNDWPIKPDIVMEGGNAACDGQGVALTCEDLSLLSTWWKPTDSLFWPFNSTSAATAQAAWFAAQLQYEYPNIWPETIRALIVHSARWTDALKKQFKHGESKGSYAELLRICGWGVPDLARALYSARNSLTLISQAELQPFDKRSDTGRCITKDMHLYKLPWPRDVLMSLPPETHVEMRITLSYFIEPGPGERGWKDRYRYASHLLRFDINSPEESQEEFVKRINKAAREEDEEKPDTASAASHWTIGSISRNKGSIHSDIWNGTAQQLAESNFVAIYPAMGWWRLRYHLGKWDRRTRYALVVSIWTPEEDVDIYTPVANQVGIAVPVTT